MLYGTNDCLLELIVYLELSSRPEKYPVNDLMQQGLFSNITLDPGSQPYRLGVIIAQRKLLHPFTANLILSPENADASWNHGTSPYPISVNGGLQSPCSNFRRSSITLNCCSAISIVTNDFGGRSSWNVTGAPASDCIMQSLSTVRQDITFVI